MNESLSTPVLFLIFNRPDTTATVFEKIRQARPARLFISADGPRPGKNEEQKCIAARKIIEQVDWDCELKTKLNDVNLGCKKSVSSGIDWFFSNVEEGIILEDDCLPDSSFFNFCSTLLEKYRNDQRVMHIGGTNFQDGIKRGSGSYYFSRLVHVWGWATWKRVWQKYDVNIPTFNDFLKSRLIEEIFTEKKQQEFWIKMFHQVYAGEKDTWDFQWVYTSLINNSLSIIPNKNLVTNLGFGEDATHTRLKASPLSMIGTEKLDEIIHPEFFIPSKAADDYTFHKYLSPGKIDKLFQVIGSGFKK